MDSVPAFELLKYTNQMIPSTGQQMTDHFCMMTEWLQLSGLGVVWCVRFNLGQEARVDGVRLYIGRLPSTPHKVKVYYFDRYIPTKLMNSLFSAFLLLVAATVSLLLLVVRRLEVNAVLHRLSCDRAIEI